MASGCNWTETSIVQGLDCYKCHTKPIAKKAGVAKCKQTLESAKLGFYMVGPLPCMGK